MGSVTQRKISSAPKSMWIPHRKHHIIFNGNLLHSLYGTCFSDADFSIRGVEKISDMSLITHSLYTETALADTTPSCEHSLIKISSPCMDFLVNMWWVSAYSQQPIWIGRVAVEWRESAEPAPIMKQGMCFNLPQTNCSHLLEPCPNGASKWPL